MTDFNGRTILVTGATGGIGGATVRHLVDAGADVIASGQSEEGLKPSSTTQASAPCPLTSHPKTASAWPSTVWTCGGW